MKKILSLLCSLTIITGTGAVFFTNAADETDSESAGITSEETSPEEEDESAEQKTPVGTAHLTYSGTDVDVTLDGEMIYADGQYDMTWNTADSGINEADVIELYISNHSPNPIGLHDELSLEIDEIWVDGEKLDITLNGKPSYGIMLDSIYPADEIVGILFPLRNLRFNDLDTTIDNEIRIVFTMNGLIDNPDTYRDEHPADEPMPAPPSASETTTTTASAETTASAAVTTASASKNTGNNPPETGDAGLAGIFLAGTAAAAVAFTLRKRED